MVVFGAATGLRPAVDVIAIGERDKALVYHEVLSRLDRPA
jgi:hypothetical protein